MPYILLQSLTLSLLHSILPQFIQQSLEIFYIQYYKLMKKSIMTILWNKSEYDIYSKIIFMGFRNL